MNCLKKIVRFGCGVSLVVVMNVLAMEQSRATEENMPSRTDTKSPLPWRIPVLSVAPAVTTPVVGGAEQGVARGDYADMLEKISDGNVALIESLKAQIQAREKQE